jgi:hypothetical protein
MLAKLVDALFGCLHTNYTFPQTIKPRPNNTGPSPKMCTYVVCLDCGKALPYDWSQMRVVPSEKNAA